MIVFNLSLLWREASDRNKKKNFIAGTQPQEERMTFAWSIMSG